ncbi:hypothetical protein [Actinoplanes sp. L3-i22]|uniref:hypothetical protein n=1 Tax=Actinoplanes sp. L3-i22 TaxID=2836373 RepID=UPI001C779A1B|nr:hypothetical protein [Actinoplanes sp. L3-i22]BCY07107.1 hypothetical protein L3i22_021950 [Actinoplanes sp. L3-i22]
MRRHLGPIFDLTYLVLMTNVLLSVTVLPLFFVPLAAPLAAPALCAAFAVFAGHPGPVAGTFLRAWWATLRKATALGGLAAGALVLLGADIRAAWGRPAGAALIPVLAVLIVLVLATTLLSLVALAERPGARLRDVLRASLLLSVRRWYLTLPSLLVLVLFQGLFMAKPVLAFALAASPLLYAVWANSRYTLAPVLIHPQGRTL